MGTSGVERPETGELAPVGEDVPAALGELVASDGEVESESDPQDRGDGRRVGGSGSWEPFAEPEEPPAFIGDVAATDLPTESGSSVAVGPGPPGHEAAVEVPAGETATGTGATGPEEPGPGARGARRAPTAPTPAAPAAPSRAPRAYRRSRPRGLRDYRLVGYLLLALVTAACVAMSVALVMKMRAEAAATAREAANYHYTPPPAAARTSPVVTVIGDGSTFGADGRPAGASEWPALVGSRMKATVVTLQAPGSGYVTPSPKGGGTYVSEAAKVPATSRVVVFFGGRSDQGATPVALATAVTKAVAAAGSRAPNASIVVVGPTSPSPLAPASLLQVRDTLRSAATASKVDWVDPIGQKWLIGGAGLVGNGGYPTREGQQVLERDFQSVLDRYL